MKWATETSTSEAMFQERFITGIPIRWVLKGEITIETEEETVTLRPGDAMKVPAGIKHRARVGKIGVVHVCGTKI